MSAEQLVGHVEPTRAPKRLEWLVGGLLVLGIAAVAWWAVSAWGDLEDQRDMAQSRKDASAAVAQAVPDLLSYDGATLDADIQRAQDWLSERFRPEFTDLQEELIAPAVRSQGFTTSALVERVGVVDQTAGTVSFIVFLEQNTQQGNQPEGEPLATRATVRMREINGEWLVDDLRPV